MASLFRILGPRQVGFSLAQPYVIGMEPMLSFIPLGFAERGINIRYEIRDVYFRNAFSVSQQNGLGWFYAGSHMYIDFVLTRPDFAGLTILMNAVLPSLRSIAYIGASSPRSFTSSVNAPFVCLCISDLFSLVGATSPLIIYSALLVSASQEDIGPTASKIRLVFKAEDRYDLMRLSTALAVKNVVSIM